MSVDIGWSEGKINKKDLKRIALSFLDLKNREIHCIYKAQLCIKELLSLLQNLKAKSTVLLDIPLKGKAGGFFRPAEKIMQRAGIPCRPSKNVLVKGKKLSSKIESLGFKTMEFYPFEFYKFFCLLPIDKFNFLTKAHFEPGVFKRFFPPYKRSGDKGIKNAERIIEQLLDFLKLRLVIDCNLRGKSQIVKWDIYDSLFGVIAGYLLFKHSPWTKIIRDKTGSEILILADVNLRHFFDIQTF